METIKWIEGLIAFAKVSETHSFTLAAEELGVSKSHVSKSIASLEEDLGFALLLRSTRKIQLTTQGETFLASCLESLEKLSAAKEDAIALSQTPRGSLRITLAGVFGENFIAPVAMKLIEKYPDLKIELDFSPRVVNLIEEKFDVAIRFGHLQDSSLIAQKIASRREYVCASKGYLKKFGTPKKPEELVNHMCLGQGSWSFRKNQKDLNIDIKGRLKTNNPRVLLGAALNDLGIIRLPGYYLFNELKKNRLVSILEDFSVGDTDIWAVTPKHSRQNVNTQVFIDEVKKHLHIHYSDVRF